MSDDTTTRAERIQRASAERRRRRKAEVRRAILDAASKLFLDHGYEDFSLRRVAQQVGYTPTTIYLYFDDKDDLLFTVAREGFEQFGVALRAGFEGSLHPIDRIEAIGRAYIAFGTTHPAYYRLMFMERSEYLTRHHPGHGKPAMASFEVLVQAVEAALAAGHLVAGDARTHSNTLWAGVHGITALGITMSLYDDAQVQEMTDLYFRTFRHGAAREPSRDV